MISLQARSRIFSTVRTIIEERRRRRRSEEIKNTSDFLEILLCVDTLSEDEKVSFVLDSLLGGYETTSLLMDMLVYFLGQSPAALHKLKVPSLFYPLISFFFFSPFPSSFFQIQYFLIHSKIYLLLQYTFLVSKFYLNFFIFLHLNIILF